MSFRAGTLGERNKVPKILEGSSFDYDLVEYPKGYVVRLPKFAKSYACIYNPL
jgi:hypothetical protein